MTDQTRKAITAARKSGFKPGHNVYWRGPDLMVEILPGNYVNEEKARSFGVKPREDVEFARASR